MKKGFSLIELMIVMAVIAILIGLAIPSFRGMQQKANIAKAQGETRTLKTAIESARIDKGSYPTSSTTPCATYYTNTTWLNTVSATSRIIDNVLYDFFGATTTTEYNYMRGTTGVGPNYYAVFSAGLNGTYSITETAVNDGILTATERGDDIFATNCQTP